MFKSKKYITEISEEDIRKLDIKIRYSQLINVDNYSYVDVVVNNFNDKLDDYYNVSKKNGYSIESPSVLITHVKANDSHIKECKKKYEHIRDVHERDRVSNLDLFESKESFLEKYFCRTHQDFIYIEGVDKVLQVRDKYHFVFNDGEILKLDKDEIDKIYVIHLSKGI